MFAHTYGVPEITLSTNDVGIGVAVNLVPVDILYENEYVYNFTVSG